jgi:nucleotide-binding universal stress UspA family protein
MSLLSPLRVRSTALPLHGVRRPRGRGGSAATPDPARERRERDGIAATGYASGGRRAEEILRTAEVFAAELIALGGRSLGTIGRLVLGSVSTKVMHEAYCDVLIVK